MLEFIDVKIKIYLIENQRLFINLNIKKYTLTIRYIFKLFQDKLS